MSVIVTRQRHSLMFFMAWLDRNSRSPREMINRMKIGEILGVKFR
jgi:hypothetical protein